MLMDAQCIWEACQALANKGIKEGLGGLGSSVIECWSGMRVAAESCVQ